MSSGELALLGMDYIALGHFHNTLRGVGKSENIYNPEARNLWDLMRRGSTVSLLQNRLCVKRGKKTSGKV